MTGASVIVPTYRRAALLKRCLLALLSQKLETPYEIIVCDDGPDEATLHVVEEFGSPALVYVPVGKTQGPAQARNAGAAKARYEILAFTDDDCIPDPAWLSSGLDALKEPAIAAVCGKVIVPLPPIPTDYEKNESGLERAEFVTANLFCRKEIFLSLGGFDADFPAAWREDSEFQFKLMEHGYVIRREDKALVYHPVRPAAWGISIFQQRKSMFEALLYKKHPRLYRRHISRRPPILYYSIVLSLVAAIARGSAAAAVLWFGLTAVFFLRRIRNTAKTREHLAEMAVSSLLIPFLSIYWRLRGALRYRVAFF